MAQVPSLPDPSGPTVRIPSREEVRETVARHFEAMRRAGVRGGNVHQMGLDHQDQVQRYAAALEVALGPVAASTFVAMWEEETLAMAAHVETLAAAAERRRIRRQAAPALHESDTLTAIGKVAGPIVLVLVVLWVLSML